MEIKIVVFGNLKEKYWNDAVKEYRKRLGRFCKLRIVELREEKISQNPSQKEIEKVLEKEYEDLVKHVGEAYYIALDRKGQEFSSEKIGKKLSKYEMEGINPVFIIGSSYGLSAKCLQACQEKWSFSKLTFPHQMMRVILLEQIYRGFKIKHGETYHK